MSTKLSLSAKVPSEQLLLKPDVSKLKDKRVLITGGASGLGAEFARAYAEAGAVVTIVDLNESLAAQQAAKLQERGAEVQAVAADVSNWQSLVAAFLSALSFGSSLPRLDHVIACAAIDGHPFFPPNQPDPSVDRSPEEPETKIFDINVKGMLYTLRLAQYYLSIPSADPHHQDKSILMMGSSGGYVPIPMSAAYGSTKTAARGMFWTMRGPLATLGLRLNFLAPWLIRTPMTAQRMEIFEKSGYPAYGPEIVTKAAMHVATDESIVGRAIHAGLGGIYDLRDDYEGQYGGAETETLINHLGGREKLLQTHQKMLNIFGYDNLPETL